MTRIFTSLEYRNALLEYRDKGYTVYCKVLPEDICKNLSNKILEESADLLFRDLNQEDRPNLNENNFKLLVDSNYRKNRNISDTVVWKHGNTRAPIWSKNNGMINIYYIKELHKQIHFNPQVFLLIANLYEHNNIGFTKGPDRVSFKVNGSTNMPTHLDYNLFDDNNDNDPVRVQSFFNCSVPTDVPVQHSGTIQVIPYFHHYWEIAKRYFRKGGNHPLPNNAYKTTCPQPWSKEFNKELPMFNTFLYDLHSYANGTFPTYKILGELELYKDLLHTLPDTYHKLEWTPIKLEAGDIMCWNQKLPHGSLANKSNTPRIVSYISFFPFPSVDLGYSYNWNGSEQQKELLNCISRGINIGQGSNRDNELERRYLRPENFNYIFVPDEPSLYFSTLEEYKRYCLKIQGFNI